MSMRVRPALAILLASALWFPHHAQQSGERPVLQLPERQAASGTWQISWSSVGGREYQSQRSHDLETRTEVATLSAAEACQLEFRHAYDQFAQAALTVRPDAPEDAGALFPPETINALSAIAEAWVASALIPAVQTLPLQELRDLADHLGQSARGAFNSKLRLPRLDSALTIANASILNEGDFDLNAHGQLQLPAGNPAATLLVPTRQPLHLSHTRKNGLGIAGKARLRGDHATARWPFGRVREETLPMADRARPRAPLPDLEPGRFAPAERAQVSPKPASCRGPDDARKSATQITGPALPPTSSQFGRDYRAEAVKFPSSRNALERTERRASV